jgi:hypothetical protein
MEAMSVAQRVSAEEYLAWDGPRGTNLVEGEIVMPQPRRLHQEILMRALHALRTWSEAGAGRGLVSLPLDVGLDDGNVYAPDVLWYLRCFPLNVRFGGGYQARSGSGHVLVGGWCDRW